METKIFRNQNKQNTEKAHLKTIDLFLDFGRNVKVLGTHIFWSQFRETASKHRGILKENDIDINNITQYQHPTLAQLVERKNVVCASKFLFSFNHGLVN